ncbi:MAG: ferric reductase [Peptococcaceae bacterium]|nr:ferric reductase [Peptococcaceae bacterium]
MSVFSTDFILGVSAWQLIRAAGLTSYMLLFLSTALGLLQSSRIMPKKSRPYIVDFHSSLSWLSLIAIFIHITALYFHKFIPFSITEILVPFTSDFKPLETGAGIIVLYFISILILSHILKRKFGFATWRAIHYLSYIGFFTALFHGFYVGTDSREPFVYGMYLTTAVIVALLSCIRWGLYLSRKGTRGVNIKEGQT